MSDDELPPHHERAGGFTLRQERISGDAANEFNDRLQALALEFAHHPRSGSREYALLIGVFPTNRLVAPPADHDGSTTEDQR